MVWLIAIARGGSYPVIGLLSVTFDCFEYQTLQAVTKNQRKSQQTISRDKLLLIVARSYSYVWYWSIFMCLN